MLGSKLATALLVLAACAPAEALRVAAMPRTAPIASAAARTSAPVMLFGFGQKAPEPPAPPKEIKVEPLQGVFAGGGALGVVFAAYCTSTGSPPTGLFVAFIACLFMAGGATIVESGGLPKRE